MNTDQLLDVASYAGKLLIESGAEIYRVEETMVRLCTSFSEVEDAQSFVTTTGIMFSITVASKTHTKILRVHTRGVDLNCIDKINSLSRETAVQNYTIEELALKLREIENEQRYSFSVSYTHLDVYKRQTMCISIVSMWLCRICLSWLLGVILGLGVLGVWLAMFTDWLFRILWFFWRYRSGSWMKKRIIT